MDEIKEKMYKQVFEKAENLCKDTINQIVFLAYCARREGLVALEERLEKNPLTVTLLRDGIYLAEEGAPQELIDVYIHYINIYTSIVSVGVRGLNVGENPKVLRMQLNAILRKNIIKDDIAEEDKELYERLRTYMENCKYPVPNDGIIDIYFRPSDHYWCPVKNGLANDIILVDRSTYHHLDKYKGQAVEELLKMEEFKKYIFDETQKLVRQEEETFLQWEKDEVLKNMLKAYISTCTKYDTGDFFNYYCIENGCLECCEKPNENLSKLLKYRGRSVEDILKSEDFKKDIEIPQIIRLDECESTHKFMRENAANLPEWAVATAEYQTGGHGRHGRAWVAPRGKNLCFNVLLPAENLKPEFYAPTTQIAAITLANMLRKNGIDAKIKWPNDILVNKQKICGIISELLSHATKISLGIGLNVNTESFAGLDRPATSMFIEKGKTFDRDELLQEFLTNFRENFELLCKEGLQPFIEEWRKMGCFVGDKAKISEGGTVLEGIIEAVQNDGSLLFRTENGLKTIWSGDLEI